MGALNFHLLNCSPEDYNIDWRSTTYQTQLEISLKPSLLADLLAVRTYTQNKICLQKSLFLNFWSLFWIWSEHRWLGIKILLWNFHNNAILIIFKIFKSVSKAIFFMLIKWPLYLHYSRLVNRIVHHMSITYSPFAPSNLSTIIVHSCPLHSRSVFKFRPFSPSIFISYSSPASHALAIITGWSWTVGRGGPHNAQVCRNSEN